MATRLLSRVGFIASVIGFLGLLFGRFLFFIFPIPLVCGIVLIGKQTSRRDMVKGITCIIVASLLVIYLIRT